MPETSPLLRIGELSRRSGVSPELLRAWERRYGLLQPVRSEGGLRLYSQDDLARVQLMQQHQAAGLAAAEAAALAARASGPAAASSGSGGVREELLEAFAAFDGDRAQAILDELFSRLSIDAVLEDVVLPVLHELGERWERGEASIAEEHFATDVLRGRLLGFARDWGRGLGPRAVLACPPGERHDLGLIAFGLALRARGWRIVYLGADTPLDSVAAAVQACKPRFVVLSAVDATAIRRAGKALAALAARVPVCIGGPAAAATKGSKNVELLTGAAVEEAERLTRLAA